MFGDKCIPTNHTAGSITVDLGDTIGDSFGDNVTIDDGHHDGSGGSHDDGHFDCTAQDQEFQRIFLIGYSLGMVLSFPLGLCLDRLGSVPTRLMAGLVYTLGHSAKMFARTIKNLLSAESAAFRTIIRT